MLIYEGFLSFRVSDNMVPLAPIPSMAMLIIIKAKWYQSEIENILVRVISYARLENEQRNIINTILESRLMVLRKLCPTKL